MPLTIISRRSITYREAGNGEVTVLLVPAREQIQVVKDLAGLGNAPVQVRENSTNKVGKNVAAGRKQIQLSRVHIGRRFIYGNLPTEISDLRQPVRVWLAEDFAPPQSQAFFYIFSNTVIIHGVREQDEEGFAHWRTAQLPVDETDPLKSMINAISDYALSNPSDGLVVAVLNKLDLYEKLQKGLATYSISPVPFSKLKPGPNIKPLYTHHDFTLLYLTLALFGLIALLASSGYLILTYLSLKKLETEVVEIQQRIDNIKLNQNVGKIADPQIVLRAMSRPVNQQPSAIIDAAGNAAASLGRLNSIKATFGGGDTNVDAGPIGPGQLAVQATIEKMNEELLVMQEQSAAAKLATMPWVRQIKRSGVVGDHGDLVVVVQIDQAPDTMAPAQPVVSGTAPVSASVAPVSSTTVSATTTSVTTVSASTAGISASTAVVSMSAVPVSATAKGGERK